MPCALWGPRSGQLQCLLLVQVPGQRLLALGLLGGWQQQQQPGGEQQGVWLGCGQLRWQPAARPLPPRQEGEQKLGQLAWEAWLDLGWLQLVVWRLRRLRWLSWRWGGGPGHEPGLAPDPCLLVEAASLGPQLVCWWQPWWLLRLL